MSAVRIRIFMFPLTIPELERRIAQSLARFVQSPLTISVEATPEGLREGRLQRIHISCSPCPAQGVQIPKMDVVIESRGLIYTACGMKTGWG